MRLALAVSLLAAIFGCPALWAQGAPAAAADFPSRPIRWIMPFPPGGPSDAVARIIGQRLSERLKQPVLIDNRAGASGSIGMEAAARSAADGYTIVFAAPGSVVINSILHKLNFDPLNDLTAVSQLATFSFVLLVNRQFPAGSVPELLAAARAKPGALTCGAGAALQQIACELLKSSGRVDLTTVPYKGGAPALNDLIAGQIHFVFEVPNVAIPQVRGDRVRAIATTNSSAGSGPFGQLPTINATLPGFEVESWFGVLAPRATPRAVIARLNREFAAVLAEEDVRARLIDAGLEPTHGSPEAFADVMRRDQAKYARIIREAGIKAEGS
jgi:tripartite-type tricarboxylate transporter receptor subunit TctC